MSQQIDRRFHATMLGSIVTDKLIQAFPDIMDVQFTAGMELQARRDRRAAPRLDQAASRFLRPVPRDSGRRARQDRARRRHAPRPTSAPSAASRWSTASARTASSWPAPAPRVRRTQPVDQQGKPTLREVSEYKCPICGREMIKRKGRFGEFLGCSGYSVKNEEGRADLHDDHQPRQGRQAASAQAPADQDDRQLREVRQPDAAARQQARPVPRLLDASPSAADEDGQEARRATTSSRSRRWSRC